MCCMDVHIFLETFHILLRIVMEKFVKIICHALCVEREGRKEGKKGGREKKIGGGREEKRKGGGRGKAKEKKEWKERKKKQTRKQPLKF